MAKISLRWVEEKVFVGTDSNGHSIVIGRTSAENHPWDGLKPSDLLLLAVASCAAYDVVEILTKQREPLYDFRVETSGDQLAEPPYSFTSIRNHCKISGPVDPKKVEKAIQLAEDKYCSVISSLRPKVDFHSDFEILQ